MLKLNILRPITQGPAKKTGIPFDPLVLEHHQKPRKDKGKCKKAIQPKPEPLFRVHIHILYVQSPYTNIISTSITKSGSPYSS
jgi:hypothetical protein